MIDTDSYNKYINYEPRLAHFLDIGVRIDEAFQTCLTDIVGNSFSQNPYAIMTERGSMSLKSITPF